MDSLHISDANRKESFLIAEEFSGLGTTLRVFDNNKVQLLCMELEWEFMVSVHFFVITPENIRDSAVVDIEIWSDNFTELKYEVSNASDGVLVKIAGGIESREVFLHF